MYPTPKNAFVLAQVVIASAAVSGLAQEWKPGNYVDPVPHDVITEPYRVCQDLDELTSRINNVYRKPYHKLFDKSGAMQPETIFFKDVTSGHEVMSLTRELCTDISHSDLGRPVWTVDGRQILFMGNRGLVDNAGKLKKTEWAGKNYVMNADYSTQRAMVVEFVDAAGNVTGRADGMPGKYNILDPINPRLAYYADADKLFRVTLSTDNRPFKAEQIATFATKQRKIIQAISRDRKLLIQDLNADPDRKTGALPYMPEIHLVDLNKSPSDPGYYYHHPFDYGLPEVKDASGKVLHDAKNNYQFHSLMFSGGSSNRIGWNYGPMTSVGEYLGYSLDITNGLDGTPEHGPIVAGSGGNPFGQYESHGRMLGGTDLGLYYSGPATVDGKKIGNYGLYLRDYSDSNKPPIYVTAGPGGHVAGGESFNPFFFAAHIQGSTPEWRKRVPESDAIVFGDARQPDKAKVLCFTYSDVRGGTKVDRQTKKVTWSGMDNNDFRPYTSIPRPLLSRDATKVWFHSSMLMPTEDWTGIYIAVLRRPDAPTDLSLAEGASTTGVKLQWKPAAGAVETKGFHVYRRDGGSGEFTELTKEIVPARVNDAMQEQYAFIDTTAQAGKKYDYAVTAEEWSTLESDTTSNTLAVAAGTATPGKPVTKFDKTPPIPPSDFAVVKETDEAGQYRLKWTASSSSDVRYYNVYFSAKEKPAIEQKRLIASPLPSTTSYLDWTAPTEGGASYAITAVDRQGNESAPVFAEAK